MNNEPVAWMETYKGEPNNLDWDKSNLNYGSEFHDVVPLYTQDQLEEARKLGMQQEQALWELAASTQEIMDTHPAKEHFEDEPQAEELHEILQSNTELTDEEKWEVFTNLARSPDLRADMIRFADSILRKAQENEAD